jgi:hypothetical protein
VEPSQKQTTGACFAFRFELPSALHFGVLLSCGIRTFSKPLPIQIVDFFDATIHAGNLDSHDIFARIRLRFHAMTRICLFASLHVCLFVLTTEY